MADVDELTQRQEEVLPSDGRVARRQRNIEAVLDVVLQMFAEESLFPTIEQAATRSGLSLRSVYRYFADPGELLEATIAYSNRLGDDAARIHAIGEGPLEHRIAAFIETRFRVYGVSGSVFRATVANAARHPRIAENLEVKRHALRAQFEQQFAPELKQRTPLDRSQILAAGDLLTQLESVDLLVRYRDISVDEAKAVLISALETLLG